MSSTSRLAPSQQTSAKSAMIVRCPRTDIPPRTWKSAATIAAIALQTPASVVSAAVNSIPIPTPLSPVGSHEAIICGTTCCGSSSAAPLAWKSAAPNTITPYSAKTSTALTPTATKAVRSSFAAKIFCPYHGAAM